MTAASDNVLRGGLTPKHIDIPELLDVLTCDPMPIPYLTPPTASDGTESFEPDITDFRQIRISTGTQSALKLEGPAIVGCIKGKTKFRGDKSLSTLAQGDFLFVTPDESQLTVAPGGEIYVATKALSSPQISSSRWY